MTTNPDHNCILVVGTGPTGLAAALALAGQGLRIQLAGPPAVAPAGRTAALFAGSVEMLAQLGLWQACSPGSAPITGIRLIDDTGGLLRAPETLFKAADSGRDAFGYNVPNTVLVQALNEAVARTARIARVLTPAVTALDTRADGVTALLEAGERLEADLVVAADGRNSVCRNAAGIGTRTWSYDQTAVVTSFAHGRPHRGISSELHRRSGPLTTVPLPGQCSSLVWVETAAAAAALMRLDDGAFRTTLERHLQGLLGGIGDIAPRACYPLSTTIADRFAERRVALVGEAAHVFPPIGAQGLNLGLRDVATLADVVSDAVAAGRDAGGTETAAAYDASRRTDITTRTFAVDMLNRSLIVGLLPADLLRGAALHAVTAFPALRDAIVRQGLQPAGPAARLMQPQDLPPMRPMGA